MLKRKNCIDLYVIKSIVLPVSEAHEILATGIIAPSEEGIPVLHIHGALGRAGYTLARCLRPGLETWLTGEVVIYEIIGVDAKRLLHQGTGFKLLNVTEKSNCTQEDK